MKNILAVLFILFFGLISCKNSSTKQVKHEPDSIRTATVYPDPRIDTVYVTADSARFIFRYESGRADTMDIK